MSTLKERGAQLAGFDAFEEAINAASYHHADDSGKEWGAAGKRMNEAAQIAFDQGWSIQDLHDAFAAVGDYLLTKDDIIGRIFKLGQAARAKAERL